MKPEELTNYCKKNLGIDLVYYSGKNSAECAIFLSDHCFSLGRENGCIYLNFPRKNVYLHNDEYIIRCVGKFLYIHRCELQRMINLCTHIENPDGSCYEILKCPNRTDYLASDIFYDLMYYMGFRNVTYYDYKEWYRCVDSDRKVYKMKPGDALIIKHGNHTVVKEEDIPMSPEELENFMEECKSWSSYSREDLNCISMHGMTCKEYQANIEELEEWKKSLRKLIEEKESQEAKWDIIDGLN